MINQKGKIKNWEELFGKNEACPSIFQKEYIPPNTMIEEELANMWQEVLNYDKVSIDDNFLDLGGNSLLISQIIANISEVFNISLTFKEILSTKLTIESQARVVETALIEQADPETINALLEKIDGMEEA